MNTILLLLGFLLNILPALLELLEKLLKQGKALSAEQMEKLNRVHWYMNRVKDRGVLLGCSPHGTPPLVGAGSTIRKLLGILYLVVIGALVIAGACLSLVVNAVRRHPQRHP